MCNCKCCKASKGAPGRKGDNGKPGSNAFKFVKLFTTDDIEQVFTISQAELTACGLVPPACIANPADRNPFFDIHIQVWLLSGGSPNYRLLANAIDGTTGLDYTVSINPSTGLITFTTYNNFGDYRVVVLA